jgi:type I restriction enzyme R subunit/putative DNA methylase
LEDERIAQCVAEALMYGEQEMKLYSLDAWVTMSNHVHILIVPNAPLPRITKAIKNFSANRANEILGRMGQPFWQDESYDHWVRDPRESGTVVSYIERNPVTAGLVSNPEAWRFSSAWAGQRPAPRQHTNAVRGI